MKVVDGMTKMIGMPSFELWNVIEAIEEAEEAADLEALQWAARRIMWFYKQGEVYSSDKFCNAGSFFNNTYAKTLTADPPPVSISDFIFREDRSNDEPLDALDARDALNVLQDYLKENMDKDGYKAARSSLDALQKAVKKTEAA